MNQIVSLFLNKYFLNSFFYRKIYNYIGIMSQKNDNLSSNISAENFHTPILVNSEDIALMSQANKTNGTKNTNDDLSAQVSPNKNSNLNAFNTTQLNVNSTNNNNNNNNNSNILTEYIRRHSTLSAIEAAILRSSVPIDITDVEEININGQRGIWANKSESANWKGPMPLGNYAINEDANPEIITKKSKQHLIYQQEVAIRYLR
jgi:hypothetical protein